MKREKERKRKREREREREKEKNGGTLMTVPQLRRIGTPS